MAQHPELLSDRKRNSKDNSISHLSILKVIWISTASDVLVILLHQLNLGGNVKMTNQ